MNTYVNYSKMNTKQQHVFNSTGKCDESFIMSQDDFNVLVDDMVDSQHKQAMQQDQELVGGGSLMANLEGWKPKQEWKKEGKNFLVSVSKHIEYDGENKWCVYLYVYPKHPAFARFNRDGSMFDQPHFDCHSYISYFNANIAFKTSEVCSFQLGWDYNHDGDSYYSSIDSVDQAGSIFYDAERLFDQAMSWYEDDSNNLS